MNTDVPGRETIMPWNGVRPDANHRNTRARGVVEQIREGRHRLVCPFDVAHARLQRPMTDDAG
ncbi:hypothetical protein QMZ92_34230 [Streptomyces sp. HNM0645]|uniref:hypothetical protein n=1 Tax=Streptomyces sp. HNM0645 TaxID=2782343 RepID=UPI0024B850C9|nr:hypothetical protein [Streptomyces sp. HNM0645]MDI9889249.1 hypothetical protein [Streptomyces sp. HNM0645]